MQKKVPKQNKIKKNPTNQKKPQNLNTQTLLISVTEEKLVSFTLTQREVNQNFSPVAGLESSKGTQRI